jgi:hypothetical protein
MVKAKIICSLHKRGKEGESELDKEIKNLHKAARVVLREESEVRGKYRKQK